MEIALLLQSFIKRKYVVNFVSWFYVFVVVIQYHNKQLLIVMQDGHPPLGWYDTAAYLVLPVLLIVSQYVSMEIMKPPQVSMSVILLFQFYSYQVVLTCFVFLQTNDPNQKNTLLIFKFLPLMIGYFSLSVPSGLTIYWLVFYQLYQWTPF